MTMLVLSWSQGFAQQSESVYGDVVKADVKMNYVYTMEEALRQARLQDKPIFFNCFADWAVPCHAMNKEVFSNQEFCDYMNENFINLFMEMTSKEGKPIAEQYNVQAFAHYLVLDKDGNLLLRIVGGKPANEFKECIKLALNPKTSLPGSEAIYKSGKYGKKELYNYSRVLRLAGENERFREIAKEYMALLNNKERFKAENWDAFSSQVNEQDGELFKFLIANKDKFVKQNGAKKVNNLIESCFFADLYGYATGKHPYDAAKLLNIYKELLNTELPDSCSSFALYQVAKLRGEGKYDQLYAYMNANGDKFDRLRFYIDMSFEFPDLNDEQKKSLSDYLMASASAQAPHIKRRIEDRAQQLLAKPKDGIAFEVLAFNDALAKAKAEGKLVFMDCYTTWCGPCRMMDKDIFPQQEVGEYFNSRFVCIKKDMEQGEGQDLAKRYKISAFPTMLILNADGEVLHTIVGAKSKERLIEEAEKGISKK